MGYEQLSFETFPNFELGKPAKLKKKKQFCHLQISLTVRKQDPLQSHTQSRSRNSAIFDYYNSSSRYCSSSTVHEIDSCDRTYVCVQPSFYSSHMLSIVLRKPFRKWSFVYVRFCTNGGTILNTASMQQTANSHTNQMGDFITPMHFGRVLPPNHSPYRVGISGPPQGALWGYITLIKGENGLKQAYATKIC